MRTTDSGRTWARVWSRHLPSQGYGSTLRFADDHDGFVFAGRLFYATHNGGASWHRVRLGAVQALAFGAERAYAVSEGGFESSPVAKDEWRFQPLTIRPVDVAALGQNVWVMGSAGSTEFLSQSRDGGRTFHLGLRPCVPGLGGELEPGSARVMWAVCATGMLAGVSRSTDDGARFEPIVIPRCCLNAVSLAALSARTAVVAPSASGRPTFLRTTDGGRRWAPVPAPAAVWDVLSLEFADARHGFALVRLAGNRQALWRTTDGGQRWSAVPVR